MLGVGLAAGEEADVGVAAVSTGVCGEGTEELEKAPPTQFCRGERGL